MTSAPPVMLLARHLCTLLGPPAADAGVVFRGNRVIASGDRQALRKAHPDADVHDFGDSLILPGLVNAHTHLELSNHRQPMPRPPRFVDWIMQLMTSAPPGENGDQILRDATAAGIEQSLSFGVTCVGDISAHPNLTRPLLRDSPLAAVSFGEVRAMARRREFLEPRLAAAADLSFATNRLFVGVSPHAPYSVEIPGYVRCLQAADQLHLPIATHLSETRAEREFLAAQTGEFRQLWDWLGAFDTSVRSSAGGPIRLAHAIGLLARQAALAHVNHCDEDELSLLAGGQASVVYCPRTHAYFGHPPHRWRQMQSAGINVAVGTDSRASSPDLNLVDELRLLRRLAPNAPPLQLWQMAGPRAAQAIAAPPGTGTLAIGSFADAVVFPTNDVNPLESILDQNVRPHSVWAAGHCVHSLYGPR